MADNFNYPPDWTPNQSKENRRGNFGHKTDPQNCEYVITSGAQKKVEEYEAEDAETMELTAEQEKGKLADPFYRLEHQEVDLQKKKAAEPFLVRLQRVSDARHADGTQKTCSRRRGCFKEARLGEKSDFFERVKKILRLPQTLLGVIIEQEKNGAGRKEKENNRSISIKSTEGRIQSFSIV
ncbi:putative CWC16 protein [Arabidopsis thaliana]|uniref:CWC16 protein n=3 Tax=Arabidopsis TaxID=3701 RepID=A0A8T2H5H1_ARASU|nr:coiled-coil protein, putative (DUF572) [Arabidopsis thaliana]AAG50522.1 hypothetical protein [Arabidopsis thaliana]AEE30646.1 coiled-coil protein, putative (DUF572) [Arabidopsis thaliana]KAG7647542.1 CWC16 protein [Arabidopsis thaliana x Arabidopsis arenosa]KAG7655479.1 CWC16 protein [Arabidopsis suecica]|eukprot:NP_173933.1 coiled-coil protein, putative (DUF572) [Arabidopsis thaliana]